MKLLAQTSGGNPDVDKLFGTKITPPPGMGGFGADPVAGFQSLLLNGIKLFIIMGSLVMLFFLLWGALDWITSGGDKEKLNKSQQKITNAIIGYVLIFVMLAVFGLVTGDILGVIQKDAGGNWQIVLPRLSSQ